jgi:hypothetical protein
MLSISIGVAHIKAQQRLSAADCESMSFRPLVEKTELPGKQ